MTPKELRSEGVKKMAEACSIWEKVLAESRLSLMIIIMMMMMMMTE